MESPQSQQANAYAESLGYSIAAEASEASRATFLKKTYLHLLGAVLVFAGLEAALMQLPFIESIAMTMTQGWNWLLVLGAFFIVSGIASRMAASATSIGAQYAGLGIYILIEALIFVPIIYISLKLERDMGWTIIGPAAFATVVLFAALTGVVLLSKRDFSFMRTALIFGGCIAMGLIVASIVFGFDLGVVFTVGMIGFMGLWILYTTSEVLHRYHTNQHVVASLALFAALATLLFYMIRLAWYLYAMAED